MFVSPKSKFLIRHMMISNVMIPWFTVKVPFHFIIFSKSTWKFQIDFFSSKKFINFHVISYFLICQKLPFYSFLRAGQLIYKMIRRIYCMVLDRVMGIVWNILYYKCIVCRCLKGYIISKDMYHSSDLTLWCFNVFTLL